MVVLSFILMVGLVLCLIAIGFFIADFFLGDINKFCGVYIILYTVVSVLLINNQFEIAEKLNSYREETYYIYAVIDNRIVHASGEIHISTGNLPEGMTVELVNMKDARDVKSGDIVTVKFLNGFTKCVSVKIEKVGNFTIDK